MHSVKLDPYTFGGTVASENLANILNTRYPQCIAKVSRYYHKFTSHLTNCIYAWRHFPDNGFILMMDLYKEHKFKTVKESNLPEVVKSHLLNIMSGTYREKIKIVKRLSK